MKDEIIEFFKPDKIKLAVTFFTPYLILVTLIFAIFSLSTAMGKSIDLLELSKTYFNIEHFVYNSILSILSYPFVCSIFLVYRAFRAKKLKIVLSQRTTLTLIILSLIFFNPLVASLFAKLFNVLFLKYIFATAIPRAQIVDYSINAADFEMGLKFGQEVYGIKIIRDGKLISEQDVSSADDFYKAASLVQDNDTVFYKSFIGYTYGYIVENATRLRSIEVRDIGAEPLKMVEVIEIKSNSPFYTSHMDERGRIYKIEIFEKMVVKKEKRFTQEKINIKSYKIRNSQEFFEALNSARAGETIVAYGYRGGGGSVELDKNITDWGITVRDIELK